MKLDHTKYYLVSEDDIYKIDCLIGALNLAVTEILEWRPVKHDLWRTTPAQSAYDEEVGQVIYRGDLRDNLNDE